MTFNLAIWLKMKGKEVVAYDLDPQQTLNDVAFVRREDGVKPELDVNLIGDAKYVIDCLHEVQVIFHEAQDEYERRETLH